MKLFKFIFITGLLIFSAVCVAEILVYDFDDPQKEARFNHLTAELRCPKCQNNNLADSNAPLAVDLKDIIYEKLNANESDEQIVNYLKERYGDFITYRPPVKPSTWIIWFGPFFILLVGGWGIFRFVSKGKERIMQIDSPEGSEANKDMLAKWSQEIDELQPDPEKQKNNDK